MKKTRRVLSIILCVALVLSLGTVTAFAQGEELCTLTQGCTLEAGHTGDCVLAQNEDETVIAADEVQALIEALPAAEEITAENMEDVAAQLDAIDNAKAQLSEEDIAAIDFAKYDAAAAAVLALIGEPQGEPAPTALSEVYVDPANGDDANTGDSAENAVKTIN